MSDNFLCRSLVAALDKVLHLVTGNQFKVLFYIARHSKGSPVSISTSRLAKLLNIGRVACRAALVALVAAGMLLIQESPAQAVVPAPAVYTVAILAAISPEQAIPEEAEPEPVASPPPETVDPQFVAVWDGLFVFSKTVKTPLNGGVVRRALEIGRSWNRNGYQVSAMLYKKNKWRDGPKGRGVQPPRAWIYLLNSLTMGFEEEARAERESRRRDEAKAKREQKRHVVNIQEQDLPLNPAIPAKFGDLDVQPHPGFRDQFILTSELQALAKKKAMGS